MTCSKASMLMRWKIASRRMPALLTTPSSLPKLSTAILTILLAGIASATVSKFATAAPPRFLISSATSSAGAAFDPEPSAATPGSLTTTLAPSAAQSSAISRPMPRPAPVTMMTLSCSDLAMGFSGCRVNYFVIPDVVSIPASGVWIPGLRQVAHSRCAIAHRGVTKQLALVGKDDRTARREHPTDAVADRNLRSLDLRRRDAAHLTHALLQRVHAIHAGVHVAKPAAISVER